MNLYEHLFCVAPGAKKQRLLKALIGGYPAPVPVEYLVRFVYGSHPPAFPRRVLAVLVYQMRGRLRDAGFRIAAITCGRAAGGRVTVAMKLEALDDA